MTSRSIAVLLVACLSTSCAYRNIAAPTSTPQTASPAPAVISLVSASAQDHLAVAARVLTADGMPVAQASVLFSATAGVVTPATSVTAADGVAVSSWTGGRLATITATVGALSVSQQALPILAPIIAAPSAQPPHVPTPFMIFPSVILTGQQLGAVLVRASLIPSDTPIASWEWSFGDDSPASTTATAEHVFSPGLYNVTVRARTADGGMAQNSVQISIH